LLQPHLRFILSEKELADAYIPPGRA